MVPFSILGRRAAAVCSLAAKKRVRDDDNHVTFGQSSTAIFGYVLCDK